MRQYGARLGTVFDGAIIEIVREQVDLGIDMATDGEIPREDYIHHRCRPAGIDFETSARA